MIYVLEHRYYGESQPFPTWSTKNLKYLTINNALADIAFVIDQIQTNLTKITKGERRKVITIGGSYPGALSAWF